MTATSADGGSTKWWFVAVVGPGGRLSRGAEGVAEEFLDHDEGDALLQNQSCGCMPEVVLSQCEMEYRRSRSLLDHDENGVLREMERIDSWLLGYLAESGLAKQRTFYSKRSFLHDAVAARPELAPRARPSTEPLGTG